VGRPGLEPHAPYATTQAWQRFERVTRTACAPSR